MTPLIFIILVASILILLLYWILSTYRNDESSSGHKQDYKFEVAGEFAADTEFDRSLPENTIKLIQEEHHCLLAGWNLQEAKLTELAGENRVDANPEHICLRLYESGNLLHHSDMNVSSIQGSCRLYLQGENAYYACLGIKEDQLFIPLLTSNTIMNRQMQYH